MHESTGGWSTLLNHHMPVPRDGQRSADIDMKASGIVTTADMIYNFEMQTFDHIKRVGKCMFAMAAVTPYDEELIQRSFVHDASKYSETERIPYVWLTECQRCRRAGEPFEYPLGMERMVRRAIRHHVRTNRHHPEYFADPNDMTDVDLIETVCDWTAMAQALDHHGGSAKTWADTILQKKLRLRPERRDYVYHVIELLDEQFGVNH